MTKQKHEKVHIFSFILILLTIQTAMQLPKTMILKENFMGQIIHKVEANANSSYKKGQHMVEIIMVKYRKSS